MRWLAGIALLLCLPSLALAKGAVIGPDDATLVTDRRTRNMMQNSVIGALRGVGADFDVVPASAASVANMTAGSYTVNGVTTSYDWQIILGLNKSQTTAGRSTIAHNAALLHRPDSLLKFNRWPTIPTLFVMSESADANAFATGNGCTGCSTGVAGPTVGFSTNRNFTHANYVVGGTEEWRNQVGIQGLPMHAAPAGGINRKVIVNEATGVLTAAMTNTCTDCDAPTAGRPAATDSVVLWARYRGSGDTSPMIFAQCGIAATYAADWGVLGSGLAMLDSLTSGGVFQKPFKMGLFVEGGFSRGRYDRTSTDGMLTGGTFCRADSCDTAYVKAAIDSLSDLGDRTGVLRVTLGVQVDSVSAYPYEKTWWSALDPWIRYSPRSNTGVGAAAAQAGADTTSALAPNDAWGYTRARTILPLGATGLPDDCDGGTPDTSSIYCNLKWQFNLLASQFPGKVSSAVFAPMRGDWSPTTMTRASAGPGVDSVLWAAYHAGVRALVADLDYINTNVNASGSQNAAGNTWTIDTTPGSNPAGYGFTRTTSVPIMGGGRMKMLASRGAVTLSHPRFYQGGHDWAAESGQGAFTGEWYWQTFPYYTHWFGARTPVLIVSAAQMGRAGDPDYTGQNEWWTVKWTANRMAAMNRLAGRTVATFDWIENLEP